ncbi:hypothetical protein B0H67DRAFT_550084 [Lasiosphaeris hirsuta]|uniref:Uncharacterized protein n=1 Tax=Lasiosphaeris hirsuta TaxID=260670 RepID=A0AA40AYD5_9PEZI|nr:hypothetical protein B0H67DRAFT_550084 [Lasiosphaeris hirsuta]
MAALIHPARPFWAGLDPDKPEPLDKVLAALHCFQIAPPSSCDALHFEFTINRDDHHRIKNGFPELRKLTAAIGHWVIPFEFDPSTGKLSTMAVDLFNRAGGLICCDSYRLIGNGLESLGQLDKPIGPIALGVWMGLCSVEFPATSPAIAITLQSTGKGEAPNCLVVFFNGNHTGASRYAQLIAKHQKDTQTVVAVQFALPGRMESKRKTQRLACNSFVSVFTMVDGVIKTVVQQEPLSTPGGEIKLWLSDFVKEPESLPDEFVRPFHIGASHYHPNITVPYTTILASAHRAFDCYGGYGDASIDTAKATRPSPITMPGSGKRLLSTLASASVPMSNGDKPRSLSILAGRLVANGVFSPGDKRRPLSTLADGRMVEGPMSYGRQRTLGTAVSRGPPLVASPVRAVTAPWGRLLARFPRKW